MKKIYIALALVLVLTSFCVSAQVATLPNIGSYPEYGDDFLYLANGGYAELADADVNDIYYSSTSFSVEAVVDSRSFETITSWNGILIKGRKDVLYRTTIPGWGFGFYRTTRKTENYMLYAKIGDGTQYISISHYLSGVAHIVLTWDHSTQTMELFVDGISVDSKTNTNIAPANIDSTESLKLGSADGDTHRNILMARWWSRRLSNTDISALYNNWVNNGDDRVPSSVSRNGLHSEWLMNEEVDASGGAGTGYLKDNAGNNHLQLMGNAELKISSGESLTLVYPANGATQTDKSVTLKASGGDADISNPTHPLLYFFQVDTSNNFDSDDLKESDWIPHYAEYRPFLNPSTKYYWRVKVKDITGKESSYTSAWSFTIEGATAWYVRPEGGNYGNEDGTSYANAWDGLLNVVFGERGVESGDTLYICGAHIHKMTGKGDVGIQANINVDSGSSGNDVVISGECPGDRGIVWGSYIPKYEAWQSEGSNTYSITLPGGSYAGWIFQDINKDSYTKLTKVNTLAECQNTPGTYYSPDYLANSRIYVHTTDNGDPTDRVALNIYGYSFVFPNNAHHITFKNMKIIAHYFSTRGNVVSYITFDNLTIHIAPHKGCFSIGDYNHHITFKNCLIEYCKAGIYIIAAPHSHHISVQNNTIRHMGTSDNDDPSGDDHCIGWQGGHDHLIEYNELYDCDHGIVHYNYGSYNFYNNTCRYNYIHDLWDPSQVGIAYSASTGTDLLRTTGNKCHHNIIVAGASVGANSRGITYKYENPLKAYNNIIYGNFEAGIGLGGTNYGQDTASVIFRNNIVVNPKYFILSRAETNTLGTYTRDFDYNLFYPETGNRFYFRESNDITFYNLSEWQSLSRPGFTFDPHSIVADPLFVDADFHLKPGSPAIDMGFDVGIAKDFANTPIPQGTRPDIGAYEYVFGTGCGPADLNCDGSIDIFDLIMVASNFGKTSGFDSRADTDSNNVIDIFDVVFVASRFS